MKDLSCNDDIIRDNLAIYIDISDIKSWNLNSDLTAVSLTSYKNPITENLTLLDAGLTEYDNGRTFDLENSQYIDQTETKFKVFRIGFNTGGTDSVQYNINHIYSDTFFSGYTYGNIITGDTSVTIITGETTNIYTVTGDTFITGETINIITITGDSSYSGQTGYTGVTGYSFTTGLTTGYTTVTGYSITTGFTTGYTTISGITGFTTGYTYVTGNTTGYTYIPIYDIIPVIDSNVGNYFKLNGGYLEGFFQLEGYNYQIIPHRFINGITIETILSLSDTTYNNITGNTDGFFYYMGTRAEDKYNTLFSGDTSYLTSEGHTLTHDGNPFNFVYENLYKENRRLKITEKLNPLPNSDLLSLKYSFIKESVQINYKNSTLINGIDFIVTPNNHICLFKKIPCHEYIEIIYSTNSIDNLENIYLTDNCFNPLSLEENVYDNVIGFRISEDRRLGYRYLGANGDIVEEYSKKRITITGWTQIDIVFRPYEKIDDPDLLDCFHRREGDLIIYLNSIEFTRFKNFSEFYFYGLNNQREKQIGVPYSIAWGGGSFGLKHSYHFNPHFEKDETNLLQDNGTVIIVDNTDYPYILTGSTGLAVTGISTGFTNTIGIGITGNTNVITASTEYTYFDNTGDGITGNTNIVTGITSGYTYYDNIAVGITGSTIIVTGTTGMTGTTNIDLTGYTGTTGYTYFELSGTTNIDLTGQTGTTGYSPTIITGTTLIDLTGYTGTTGYTYTEMSGITGTTGYTHRVGGIFYNKNYLPVFYTGITNIYTVTGETIITGETINIITITGDSSYSGQTGYTGVTGYSYSTGFTTGYTTVTGFSITTGVTNLTGQTGTTGFTLNISGTTTGFTTTIQLPISGITFLPEKKYEFNIELDDYESLFSNYSGNLVFSLSDPIIGETNYQIAENDIYTSTTTGITNLIFRIETPYWITGLTENLLFNLSYDPILVQFPTPHYVPVIKDYRFNINSIKLYKYDFIEDKYVKDPIKDNLLIQKNYDGSLYADIQKLRVYTSVLTPSEIKHNYDIEFPTHTAIIKPFEMVTLNTPVLVTDTHRYTNGISSYPLSRNNIQYIVSVEHNGVDLAENIDFEYNKITNSINFLDLSSLIQTDFIIIKFFTNEGQISQGGYIDRNSSKNNRSGRITFV